MIDLYDASITDILPPYIANMYEVRALGFAIKKRYRIWQERVMKSMVMIGIENLPEHILDERAAELNAPYYDSGLPVEVKRILIKNVMLLYRKAGTPEAVEQLIHYIFESGELIEWFNNNSEPGTFQVVTTAEIDITQEMIENFRKIIAKIKPAGSTLESISKGQRFDAGLRVAVKPIMAKRITIR